MAERRLDVSKTEIRAPFNGRISKVNVERLQFAPAGTVLLEAESIDRAEIPVQLSPGEFFKLLPRDQNKSFGQVPDIETIRRAIGISARVILPLNKDKVIEWEGRFSRTGESMNPDTGTLTFFVTVENPYSNLIPGKRPPLATNMYVGVELSGKPMAHRYAIPRSALHGDHIYICGPGNRLEIRRVDVDLAMADLVILGRGLAEGELLVLTDLVPAVEGMKLLPQNDEKKTREVMAQARGERG